MDPVKPPPRQASLGSLRSFQALSSSSTLGSEDNTHSLSSSFSSLTTHDVVQEVPPKLRVRFAKRKTNQVCECPWILVEDIAEDDNETTQQQQQEAEADGVVEDMANDPPQEESAPSDSSMMVPCSCIWYTDREVRAFQQYVHVFGRLVAQRERKQEKYLLRKQWRETGSDNDHDNDHANNNDNTEKQGNTTPLTWSRGLWTVFKAFHKVSTVLEINALMDTPCNGVTTFCVGLERWALPGLRPARSSARKALQKAVFQIQDQAAVVGAGPNTTALLIRKASREITQPSRLFAI